MFSLIDFSLPFSSLPDCAPEGYGRKALKIGVSLRLHTANDQHAVVIWVGGDGRRLCRNSLLDPTYLGAISTSNTYAWDWPFDCRTMVVVIVAVTRHKIYASRMHLVMWVDPKVKRGYGSTTACQCVYQQGNNETVELPLQLAE